MCNPILWDVEAIAIERPTALGRSVSPIGGVSGEREATTRVIPAAVHTASQQQK
jgi:hypothetical protein